MYLKIIFNKVFRVLLHVFYSVGNVYVSEPVFTGSSGLCRVLHSCLFARDCFPSFDFPSRCSASAWTRPLAYSHQPEELSTKQDSPWGRPSWACTLSKAPRTSLSFNSGALSGGHTLGQPSGVTVPTAGADSAPPGISSPVISERAELGALKADQRNWVWQLEQTHLSCVQFWQQ